MDRIKELSDFIKRQHGISLTAQAERLSNSMPSFNYTRLMSLRSGKRYNEQPTEVKVFKQVFAKELEGYGGAGEETDPDEQLTAFKREVAELKELLKTANTDREDVQRELRKLHDIIERQSKIIDKLTDKEK